MSNLHSFILRTRLFLEGQSCHLCSNQCHVPGRPPIMINRTQTSAINDRHINEYKWSGEEDSKDSQCIAMESSILILQSIVTLRSTHLCPLTVELNMCSKLNRRLSGLWKALTWRSLPTSSCFILINMLIIMNYSFLSQIFWERLYALSHKTEGHLLK